VELTKRQQETLKVIQDAGPSGIGFKALKKLCGVRGTSTLRQRLGQLTKLGSVKSELDGKYATYRAVAK